MSRLLGNLVRFGRMLRGLGLDVQAGSMLEVARALRHVDIGRRADFYFTLRCLLVHRAEDLPVFDEAFQLFWRPPAGGKTKLDLQALGEDRRFGKPEVELASLSAVSDSTDAPSAPREKPERVELQTFSARETLREKDFSKLTAEEMLEVGRLMAELSWQPGLRRSRRWMPGRGPAADIRRALRASVRQGGEPLEIPTRERKLRRRPLVLLCDISGSMERYTRMLLQFLCSLSTGFERVEVFLFATRLSRVTLQLRRRRIDEALRRVRSSVPDWSGGTRIGDALRAFNVDWSRRVLGGGPVVLLISDGWDRGDPQALGREIARLQRSCHRLIWLNPLLGSSVYEPLTRGMQAALPFVDDFLPVHNLTSLDKLAARLNALPERRQARRPRVW